MNSPGKTVSLSKKETHRVSLLYVGIVLSSRSVARQVFSALQSLTSVFGMGTGGPSATLTPTLQGFPCFFFVSTVLSSRSVARQVFSALQSLTSVFGMGTGGPSVIFALTFFGAPSGIRTRDPLIKSQLLYHLS